MNLEGIAQFVLNIFRFHKLKLAVVFISALVFVLLLFPYDDLNDFATAQVSKLSQSQVFLQADRLGINLFPSPGVSFDSVKLETPNFPPIHTERLTISPSILSLLAFKPGFNVQAEGLLKGDVDITVKAGNKIEGAEERIQNIKLDVDGISLKQAKSTFELPIPLEGSASALITAEIDPTFRTQPEGDVDLELRKINIPATTIPTAMGPMALPSLKFSTGRLKGRISGGEVVISVLELGDSKEPLSGRAKGKMGLKLQKRGMTLKPLVGSYEFKVELNVKKSMEKELGIYFMLLEKFKNPTLTGSRYAFKANGSRPGAPPKMTPLSTF